MDSKILAHNLRIDILNMIAETGASHVGPNLSIVDILAVLYTKIMNYDINKPNNRNRDQFILSKGHAGASVYAVLAEMGFFSKDKLNDYYKNGTSLSGHVSNNGNPGVDFHSGSLGLGITIAVGKALAQKMDDINARVFTIVGNGECNEGSVWEAAMFASHNKLDNLVAVVDNNGLQIDGKITDVCSPMPITDKFEAFGWHVITMDAHDFDDIERAFDEAEKINGKPVAIIQTSTKGKGVSFMENQVGWHGTAPKKEQAEQALSELEVAE